MAPNVPNLMKNIILHFQEAQLIPNTVNSKRCIPRYIIVMLLRDKNKKNLEVSKGKATYCKRSSTLTTDISSEIMKSESRKMIYLIYFVNQKFSVK